ncbi:MAG: TPM domain-containing protein [Patescibacteria group bacterium]|nr:TPM domain-containing protein [Patescibacteria group bacterium]
MTRHIKIVILFFLVVVFFSRPVAECYAQKMEIPGRTDRWVNDYAGIVDPATEESLEKTLSDLNVVMRSKTPDPVEIIIGTFNDIDGWTFADFALQYAENWRAGRANRRDNGVVIVVAPSMKSVRIGVGRNIENILPASMVNYTIQEIMVPEFRQGKYSEGLKNAVDELAGVLRTAEIPKTSYLPFVSLIIAAMGVGGILRWLAARKTGKRS